MRNHHIVVLCDICRKTTPDEAAKEVLYGVDRSRYSFKMCASCLNVEMARLAERRWVPGARKQVALIFNIDSVEALPVRPAGVAGGVRDAS